MHVGTRKGGARLVVLREGEGGRRLLGRLGLEHAGDAAVVDHSLRYDSSEVDSRTQESDVCGTHFEARGCCW
eukprot:6189923-Pleurochrysis_carterae.AAC.2